MKTSEAALLACLALFAPGWQVAANEIEIGSPGFPPTKVNGSGAILEPWGAVELRLVAPEGATLQGPKLEPTPMPAAVTGASAGPVQVTQTAYRAPIWPGGADVLECRVRNSGKEPAKAVLELKLPEGVQVGERIAVAAGKPAMMLPLEPAPIREEREWGCLGGVNNLPGWAKPKIACDPAFRSIAAGMGGVAIRYRFAAPKGEGRGIALGFCESHHPGPGYRAMDVTVEGAPMQTLDPNAKWGRHQPGVLQFAASDANQDGRIDVRVAPHPGTSDHNPILNAIWVFKNPVPVDEGALVRGELNAAAERFVDVGGEGDQLLYKDANLRYALDLAAGQQRELSFLLRSEGASVLPDPANTTWTSEKLRKAATEVWASASIR